MFVGDSLIRYQFLALMSTLHNGQLAVKSHGLVRRFPSEVWEREQDSEDWMMFFNSMVNALGPEWVHCDCFRNSSIPANSILTSQETVYYWNRFVRSWSIRRCCMPVPPIQPEAPGGSDGPQGVAV